ncbi:hypothetical protein B0H11DRAFT_2024674 [Mycena galericulata]|nr:hypothetical protein B0H11DRAFT_2024674 [Mycena galericulata]
MNSTEECSAMNVDGLIAESELKISNIDSQFEHLQSMRAAEYKKIAALKYLSSSLHGLPTEVLCEIFLYTVAPVRTKKKLTVIENPNAILPISQVCHFWREVAHNTPHLWTDLCITVTTYPSDAFIAGIKTWLGRSRQLPLSITIAANVKHTNSLLIDEILLVRSRVAHLELTMPTYYSAIAPLLDAQLDALQTLRMNQRSLPDMYSMWAEKRDLATFAPNLRNLSVDYLAYWPEFFSNTPWSQLLHLRISSTNLERLGVLRQCVNLETLALRIGDWVTLDHVVGSADLTLPNLLHIELCVFSDTISPIFQQLVLPVLVSFRIDFEYPSPFVSGPIVWPQQSFLQFQKRCPTIQYLGLRYTTALTSNELIPILRSFPALKRLSLVSCTGCVD